MSQEEAEGLIDATPSGMAHLSGTGPPGTVCEQCSFYGFHMQHPNSCYRYYLMVSEHGAAFPAETPSCKYFAPRNMGLATAEAQPAVTVEDLDW